MLKRCHSGVRRQRLNNRAAILQSRNNVMGDGSSSSADERVGARGAIVEVASHRVTRLGWVLATWRPPDRLAVESSNARTEHR